MNDNNQNKELKNNKIEYKPLDDTLQNTENYQNYFDSSVFGLRPSLGCFGPFDENPKITSSIFLNDFEFKNIHTDEVKDEIKFKFDPEPSKDARDLLENPFNFNFEYELPEVAKSYNDEFSFDFELTPSEQKFHSFDDKKIINLKDANKIGSNLKEIYSEKQKQVGQIEELKEPMFDTSLSNFMPSNVHGRALSPASDFSFDSNKLRELTEILKKSKGVNKDKINDEIISRTVEFGQQKVAEELNIPYRRYKSILNKIGIKTIAGRKVNNLQLETNLVGWSLEIKEANKLLTRKMISEKATNIIRELSSSGDVSLKKTRLSKGWLDKFVKRHPNIADYITSQKGKKGQ